jgi:hypothetical protein
MRKFMCAVIAGIAFAGVAWAGGDKAQTAFADVSSIDGGAHGFSNGVSSGSSKTTGCTTQIQMKGLSGVNAGDMVICTGSADVLASALPAGGAGNSVVWRVPAKAGAIKIKSSVAIITVAGQHCGSAKAISFNAETRCYKDDPGYDPAAACATIPAPGALWVAAPTNTTGLLGLCQGFALGDRIPPPSSGEIARTGMTIAVGAK